VQINFSTFLCTLGFNAYREKVFGFVVNSHCTGSRGEVDGMRYAQSLLSQGSIATEIADPPFFTGDPCPAGKRCRLSDAAFAKYDSKPRLGVLASIARPTAPGDAFGSVTLSPASARFTITGGVPSSFVGDVLDKVGRTTGWTIGPVVFTCADANTGLDLTYFCQDFVLAGAGPGDSGSPVFYRKPQNKAQLVGILWGGGATDLGQHYVFSPLGNIQQELGTLKIK
jgi:hypothetical protein